MWTRKCHWQGKLFEPDYNILQEAGSSLGYKHTEATKVKLSARIFSEEHLAKIRAAATGRKASDATKAKILASNPKRKEVEVFDLETSETTIYSSLRQAAIALNCFQSAISYCVKSNSKNPPF